MIMAMKKELSVSKELKINGLLKSNRNAVIEDKNNQKQKEIILEPLGFYNVFLKNSNEKVFNLYRANYGRPKTLSEINSARSG